MKRYVVEEDSARVGRWLAAGQAATARLTAVEVASALARRCREGAFPPAERVDEVDVRWPDGSHSVRRDLPARQFLRIRKGS